MSSVIQNHKANLLKDLTTSTVKECRSLFTSWKCLSKCLVYNTQVDWLEINKIKNRYGTSKKNFKEHSNNDRASFRNWSKEKVQNSQIICGSWKIAA